MSALQCRGLGYSVNGTSLLSGVDLDALPGELLAVVGPNGAGKSTLIRLLSGDLSPSTGEVLLNGTTISSMSLEELSRQRAMLLQDNVLQFAFTVTDVVLMGRYPYRADGDPDADRAAAEAAMADADVRHLSHRIFPTLSGGEKTRASLARVLAQEAPVVLLDEPTTSLDLGHQELIMSVLERLADSGVAVIAVLHDLNLAARFADRVALLKSGSLEAVGVTEDVLNADLLSTVYGHPVAVIPHPHRDCPLVLTLDEPR